MEINLHIADAKKLFSEQDRSTIQNGVARAKEYVTLGRILSRILFSQALLIYDK